MKILRPILVILFFTFSLQAQFLESFGVKFGGTITSQERKYHLPTGGHDAIVTIHPNKNLVGLSAGVYAEFKGYSIFDILLELNYLQKGFVREEQYTTGESYTLKQRTDYLNFSLLIKTKVYDGIVTPYLIAGPRYDFEITKTGYSVDNPYYEAFNKNLFGFYFGVGSKFDFFNINLLAEAIYDLGITDLYDDSLVTVTTDTFIFRIGITL